MTTDADAVNQLVQEMRDLLDVSTVGLYEFLWALNTASQTLDPEARRAVARQALDRLLAEPGVILVQLRWPDSTPLAELTPADLTASAWDDPSDDGLYVAIDRPE